MPIDALSVLCPQLTRDLLAIAKFSFYLELEHIFRCYLVYLVAFNFTTNFDI